MAERGRQDPNGPPDANCAHFTPAELPQHKGWGHSDWRQCAEFAAANRIGKLWLFHHKPGRSDQALADIRTEAQKVFAATDTASEETFIDV